jgi:type I restriction enzyme M protein
VTNLNSQQNSTSGGLSLCPRCRTRELFLLNQCQDETLILRSLEEHELEVSYPQPE